ncbi:MAG TPA: helix-turn-helix domain-containing protein [Pseudobdellovibrionaceae bacterium]|nr:helix-turn-helix domain-containing protein [Pseudobdellovibrionaceae bacterium]
MSQFDRAYEVGKLYCDRGDFGMAAEHLEKAAAGYFEVKDYAQHLKSINLLLRIYAEREMFEEFTATKEKLQDVVLKEGFELNSKTYYVLGLCAFYKKQLPTALDYLNKSLQMALTADNKEDICQAIFGLANCYATPQIGKYAEALKEIYNLEVFFQVYRLPELRVSTLFLNGSILMEVGKVEEAIEVLWKAYDIIRETKNMVMSTYLMISLAECYFEIGDKDLSRTYLSLAQRGIDPSNQVRLSKVYQRVQEKVGAVTENSYDLVFDEQNHSVVERKLGRIDFKNQFILLDLLRLFVQNQGTIYSKEYLVENIWRQPYDPAVHDNKIYVTIKRLRKLIEPDYEKPKYIFRAKNGYYMNKAARVHLDS